MGGSAKRWLLLSSGWEPMRQTMQMTVRVCRRFGNLRYVHPFGNVGISKKRSPASVRRSRALYKPKTGLRLSGNKDSDRNSHYTGTSEESRDSGDGVGKTLDFMISVSRLMEDGGAPGFRLQKNRCPCCFPKGKKSRQYFVRSFHPSCWIWKRGPNQYNIIGKESIMDNKYDILQLLRSVADGTTEPEQALLQLKEAPFEDLDYAKIDLHRSVRQGAAEVIYGAGKTPEQIAGIVQAMGNRGCRNILITRVSQETVNQLPDSIPLDYHADARLAIAYPAEHKKRGAYRCRYRRNQRYPGGRRSGSDRGSPGKSCCPPV